MATAREQYPQRFGGGRGERVYWLDDATDVDNARDTLLAAAPATWEAGGLTLYRVDDDCEVYEDGDEWKGIARYASQDLAVGSGGSTTGFEFDTTGGTQHLMASYETVNAYGNGAAVGDNAGMIGVTKDGVEGVDVPVGVFNFSISKEYDVGDLDAAYLDTLADTVGRTNDATFAGTTDDGVDFSYVEDECLYLGARGGVRNGRGVITHLFSAASNKTGLTVGTITAIAKKGWEYLWVRYVDSVVNNIIVKIPRHVYVERVHLQGDFSALAAT